MATNDPQIIRGALLRRINRKLNPLERKTPLGTVHSTGNQLVYKGLHETTLDVMVGPPPHHLPAKADCITVYASANNIETDNACFHQDVLRNNTRFVDEVLTDIAKQADLTPQTSPDQGMPPRGYYRLETSETAELPPQYITVSADVARWLVINPADQKKLANATKTLLHSRKYSTPSELSL